MPLRVKKMYNKGVNVVVCPYCPEKCSISYYRFFLIHLVVVHSDSELHALGFQRDFLVRDILITYCTNAKLLSKDIRPIHKVELLANRFYRAYFWRWLRMEFHKSRCDFIKKYERQMREYNSDLASKHPPMVCDSAFVNRPSPVTTRPRVPKAIYLPFISE